MTAFLKANGVAFFWGLLQKLVSQSLLLLNLQTKPNLHKPPNILLLPFARSLACLLLLLAVNTLGKKREKEKAKSIWKNSDNE